jgi:PAS domain S-box-containing protein
MPAGIRLFGHTRRGMLGNNINMIIPEPLSSMHQKYLEKYIETGLQVPTLVRSFAVGDRRSYSVLGVTEFHH